MPRKKRIKNSIRRNTQDNIYRIVKKPIILKKRYDLQKLQPLYKTPEYKETVRPIINKLPKHISTFRIRYSGKINF